MRDAQTSWLHWSHLTIPKQDRKGLRLWFGWWVPKGSAQALGGEHGVAVNKSSAAAYAQQAQAATKDSASSPGSGWLPFLGVSDQHEKIPSHFSELPTFLQSSGHGLSGNTWGRMTGWSVL